MKWSLKLCQMHRELFKIRRPGYDAYLVVTSLCLDSCQYIILWSEWLLLNFFSSTLISFTIWCWYQRLCNFIFSLEFAMWVCSFVHNSDISLDVYVIMEFFSFRQEILMLISNKNLVKRFQCHKHFVSLLLLFFPSMLCFCVHVYNFVNYF